MRWTSFLNPSNAVSSVQEIKDTADRNKKRPVLTHQVGIQVVKGLRVVIVFIDGFNFLLFYLFN